LIDESGAEVGVVIRSLDGAAEVLIRPDVAFHAASTFKIAIMIELFRQSEEGRLAVDHPLPVRNEFRSIVDGTPYRLDVNDDSDKEVYGHVGGMMPARQLCEAMIVSSSNLATNILIEKLGVERIQDTVDALGAGGMRVLRGVEDGAAFARGLNNTTSARALMVLLTKIARGDAVSRAASRSMVEILSRQRFRDGIPARLPAGTVVAHKTGDVTAIHHDAGIVFGPRPFVIVVLVRGVPERSVSGPLIARIARAAWDALSNE
jgi:beta-lactamase class A